MYSQADFSARATRSRAKWYNHVDVLGAHGEHRVLEELDRALVVGVDDDGCRESAIVEQAFGRPDPSLMAEAAAMYSASVVDAAAVCCRRLDQLMAPPLRM
jgi:hypothetical protein